MLLRKKISTGKIDGTCYEALAKWHEANTDKCSGLRATDTLNRLGDDPVPLPEPSPIKIFEEALRLNEDLRDAYSTNRQDADLFWQFYETDKKERKPPPPKRSLLGEEYKEEE